MLPPPAVDIFPGRALGILVRHRTLRVPLSLIVRPRFAVRVRRTVLFQIADRTGFEMVSDRRPMAFEGI
ncbi:hypothetical protein KHP11_12655 [Rhodococcus erythropolis]|uniref:hypothetical protein n=1 Tax=Rhodococcus erythropolis TaxID=1833 RepID=UPI0008A54AAC|nr:hypothetical protein [Rhodococcus erythropolis]MBT1255307.1 hypothetical protein [Rhodococcus erythropolis]OHF25352.1 hypothetical protein BKP30_24440 [Rhodococcus erythropolis]